GAGGGRTPGPPGAAPTPRAQAGETDLPAIIEGLGDEAEERIVLPCTVAVILGWLPGVDALAVAVEARLPSLNARISELPVARRQALAHAIRSEGAPHA
ncbi:MAG: hypothetical protein WKF96_00290, partial [Solirubrobacteraceae bacterium]